jgi:3-oxoacyl-[acyl-carrier-protein] synthase-3
MPSIAAIIQGALELQEEVLCLDINMACTGFVGGLILIEGFLKKDELAILIGTEKISKHLDFEDRGTAILFGDGSGGVLLEKTEDEFFTVYGTRSNKEDLVMKEGEALTMKGSQVFRFATEVGASSISGVLDKAGLEKQDIDYFVCHQANERILDYIAHRLQISPLLFPKSLKDTGNVSAASIPLLLSKLKREGEFKENKRVILTGFGAGLSWASILMEVGKMNETSKNTLD